MARAVPRPSAVPQYVLGRHVNFMSARWRSMSLPGKFHGGGSKIAAHPPGGREDCTRLPMTLLLIHQYGYSLGSVGNLDRFHGDGLHIHFLGWRRYTIPLDLGSTASNTCTTDRVHRLKVEDGPSTISSGGGGNLERQLPRMMKNRNKRRKIYGCTDTIVAYRVPMSQWSIILISN